MTILDTTSKHEFWIVFGDGNAPMKWLKKGFRHVYILTRDDYNWIKIEPSIAFLNVEILGYKAADFVPFLIKQDHPDISIVKVSTIDRWRRRNGPGILGLRTCVSLVKYIIGVKFFALTPYQLFKKLSKQQSAHCKYGIEYTRNVL